MAGELGRRFYFEISYSFSPLCSTTYQSDINRLFQHKADLVELVCQDAVGLDIVFDLFARVNDGGVVAPAEFFANGGE